MLPGRAVVVVVRVLAGPEPEVLLSGRLLPEEAAVVYAPGAELRPGRLRSQGMSADEALSLLPAGRLPAQAGTVHQAAVSAAGIGVRAGRSNRWASVARSLT